MLHNIPSWKSIQVLLDLEFFIVHVFLHQGRQQYGIKDGIAFRTTFPHQNGGSKTHNQAKSELFSNIFNILGGSDPNN